MPLSDRPKSKGNEYVRVTRLVDRWFIPEDYIGTLTETDGNGSEYKTHLFKIFLCDEDHYIEFRATAKWLGAFNNFLSQELEEKFEEGSLAMKYEILGYGRQTSYKFITKDYVKVILTDEKQSKKSKK